MEIVLLYLTGTTGLAASFSAIESGGLTRQVA